MQSLMFFNLSLLCAAAVLYQLDAIHPAA